MGKVNGVSGAVGLCPAWCSGVGMAAVACGRACTDIRAAGSATCGTAYKSRRRAVAAWGLEHVGTVCIVESRFRVGAAQ